MLKCSQVDGQHADTLPEVGSFYRHFKGGAYEILALFIVPCDLEGDTWCPVEMEIAKDVKVCTGSPAWVSVNIRSGDRCVAYRPTERNYMCLRSLVDFHAEVHRPRFTKITTL